MSQTKPAKLFVHKSASRVSNLTLTSVLLLAIAVNAASAEIRNGPERIEKPSSRAATAFVPRLGKRFVEPNSLELRSDPPGRLPCASSLECNQLVLLGALVRGIAVQEGDLNLVSTDQLEDILAPSSQPAFSSFDSSNEDGLKLFRMLHRDQLPRRDTRGSSESPDEIVGSMAIPKDGGAKRLAFTPRIGRR